MTRKLRKLTTSLVLEVFGDFAWIGLKSLKIPRLLNSAQSRILAVWLTSKLHNS
jgi:hypothetical protein